MPWTFRDNQRRVIGSGEYLYDVLRPHTPGTKEEREREGKRKRQNNEREKQKTKKEKVELEVEQRLRT